MTTSGLTPGEKYVRRLDGSLFIVDDNGLIDGSQNPGGWSPAERLIIEAHGAYQRRPAQGNVVYVGVTDPASTAVDGDVWIQTSSGLSLMGPLESLMSVEAPVAKTRWWRSMARWAA
jgi:hypothetical protein